MLLLVGLLHGHFPRGILSQTTCTGGEPWGRYSASGGLAEVDGTQYMYSLGGDTRSDADNNGGGVVTTHWRWSLDSRCWERLSNTPVAVGFRGTATLLNGSWYVFGGADTSYVAHNQLWKLSLPDHTWTEVDSSASLTWPSPRFKHAAVPISNSTMLVVGGREGSNVLSDAWVFDIETNEWTLVQDDVLDIYRQGMAFDTKRNVTWLFGGLDSGLNRQGTLYRYDTTTLSVVQTGAEVVGVRWRACRGVFLCTLFTCTGPLSLATYPHGV